MWSQPPQAGTCGLTPALVAVVAKILVRQDETDENAACDDDGYDDAEYDDTNCLVGGDDGHRKYNVDDNASPNNGSDDSGSADDECDDNGNAGKDDDDDNTQRSTR